MKIKRRLQLYADPARKSGWIEIINLLTNRSYNDPARKSGWIEIWMGSIDGHRKDPARKSGWIEILRRYGKDRMGLIPLARAGG